ncbi:MAG: rod-binding protein [Alphaproteobacteria bacterium]|jgi:flagellar protein FlgJ|nr:rod-binding protein [Alphaproteobacteria bacterium]QQS58486.1 MAG: rod-binding protein [Alphaproteobacteria bacterium]
MDNLVPNTNLGMIQLSQMDGMRISDQLAAAKNAKKIDEVAQEFEAVFITEMMKPMFEGLSTDETFGGGKGEEIFRGILLQEYGKKIAQTHSIGLSAQLKAELLRQQEMQSQLEANSPALEKK